MANKKKTSTSKNKKVTKKLDKLLEEKKKLEDIPEVEKKPTTPKKTTAKKTTTKKNTTAKKTTTKKDTTKKTTTKKETVKKTTTKKAVKEDVSKKNVKQPKKTVPKKEISKTISISNEEKEQLKKKNSMGESTKKLNDLVDKLRTLYSKKESNATNINIEKFVWAEANTEVFDKTYKLLNRVTWILFIIFMILLIAFIAFVIYVCTY